MDTERCALERRAKDRHDWRARVLLALLRVHLGELDLVGWSRRHYVVKYGVTLVFLPLDPPQRVPHVLETCRALALGVPADVAIGSHRYGPLETCASWDGKPVGRIGPPSPWKKGDRCAASGASRSWVRPLGSLSPEKRRGGC